MDHHDSNVLCALHGDLVLHVHLIDRDVAALCGVGPMPGSVTDLLSPPTKKLPSALIVSGTDFCEFADSGANSATMASTSSGMRCAFIDVSSVGS